VHILLLCLVRVKLVMLRTMKNNEPKAVSFVVTGDSRELIT